MPMSWKKVIVDAGPRFRGAQLAVETPDNIRSRSGGMDYAAITENDGIVTGLTGAIVNVSALA